MLAVRTAKSTYIGLAHGLGSFLEKAGVMNWLRKRENNSRVIHWVRSLFEIHDLNGLVSLDVPWWSYGAIDAVSARLKANPDARVFEYGSGASTVWLARRAGFVTSVEHHAGWHARVRDQLATLAGAAPVDLQLAEPDRTPATDPLYASHKSGETGQTFANYARAIERAGDQPFDVIVIDGRARAACLKHAIPMLAPDGVIVFDNTGRKRYRTAIEACDLQAKTYRGLTPALPYPDETTLLFHRREGK